MRSATSAMFSPIRPSSEFAASFDPPRMRFFE
jgi:hypothetical protein